MDIDATFSSADLEDERQRLLAELLADEGFEDEGEAAIVPQHRTEARLGYAQELLWLVEQMHPGVALSNIPELFDIRGSLDVDALRGALADVIARHSSLRTDVIERNGEPVQRVHGAADLPFTERDVRETSDDARAAEVERLIAEEIRTPFAFDLAPILRATLIHVEDDHWMLLLMQHHIVCDGWSRERLFPELSARYAARRAGRTEVLPPPTIEFTDFAEWQRERAESGALTPEVEFWRERLHGAADVLELPTDRARGPVRGFEGREESIVFPAALAERVWQLGQAHGVTPFMTLFAAFQALLSRYSGQDDFIIGTPVSGRTRTELEDVIGYFANVIPLRTDLSGDPSFGELLDRVRVSSLTAFEHQDVPFERLVQELGRSVSSVHTPLFQAMFSLAKDELPELPLDGLQTSRVYRHAGWSTFDMWLFVRPLADGLRAWVEYRTDLFDAATMQRMLGHLGVLLEGFSADPARPISLVPLLTDAERDTVLGSFNATALEYPRDHDLTQLVREQVVRTPGATAVTFEGASCTYAELDARVDRLASHLQERGVAAGTVVALHVERSLDMVVALLAIHRAGGAYLPLDPSYPHDRLAFMLADSGARVLITEEALRGVLATSDVTIISLDGDRAAIDAGLTVVHGVATDPERLAYLIYTSGSTGKPKGVAVTHRNVVNFLSGLSEWIPFAEGSTLVAVTPLSFDISVLEMFHPLTTGAHLVIASRDAAMSAAALSALLASSTATHLQATPATWRMLLDWGWTGHAGLVALCGGEALPGSLASALLERGVALWNMYGPTEATIWATMHRVTQADADGAVMPIGRPMANARAYVLDPAGQLLPPGIPGELFIGGVGVARGYHARPELTAERFVADSFVEGGAARMYRTGDRAKWRNDGALEYLGRLDQQVKLRGHRIELGEIEHELASLPGIGAAAAVVREDRAGDARLVAYVVLDEGAAAADEVVRISEWRTALGAQLPSYMVPSAFVRLEQFPLTPNGKLDRKALPAPPTDEGSTDTVYVAPRTALEAQIAEVWAAVLGRARVGVEDDFFEVGGHSLLGMRILARLASQLGRPLSLRQLFDGRTVAGLAAQLAVPVAEPQLAAEAIPRLAGAEAPTAFAQELLWLVEQMTTGQSGYGGPELLRVEGALDVAALTAALTDVVTHQDALRTEFFAVDGVPRQRVLADVQVPVTVVDLRDHATPAAAALARLEAEVVQPMDLGAAPLYRATVVQVAETAWLVGLFTHHIVTDDLSRGLVFEALATAYAARSAGQAPVFAPLPVRYRDYAAWQRSRVQGAHLEELMAYWRGQLAGVPEVLELATDKPRPPVRSFVGSRRRALWSRELLAGVQALGQAHGTTLFMTLLAAFEVVLARHSGQEDFVVGSPVGGRTRPEFEGVVGYFANMLALRADLRGTPTFAELLARVRATCLGAYEHAEVPFEALVSTLGHRVQPSHAPIFQTMFGLLNPEPLRPVLAGATVELVEFEIPWSRYDLWLMCRETPAGLQAELEYRSDLFEPETIDRILTHVQTVLESVVRDAHVPIGQVELLPAAEHERVVRGFNATDTVYPAVASIQALI
ncbi:MAG: amino acid adenylation domain-containing protein, partial [bacterium]